MRFTPQTLDFLFENKLNNNKEWFHSHKQEYQELVLDPLVDLVEKLTPTVLKIDPQFITIPKPTKAISRIYRDTRFSKDKSLYRDNMWILFIRDKKLYHGLPAYFADISANGLEYGVGYYKVSSESMLCYRDMILKKEPAFLQAKLAVEKAKIFSLYGEPLKRSKAPNEPEDIKNWLDRKQIGVSNTITDFDLVFSEDLYQTIAKGFEQLKPVYDFLMAVETRRSHNNRED